jgi:hypothetical protein
MTRIFVTLPEALPIAVIRRFINWFTEFGIPVGGVVVNGVIETDDPGSRLADHGHRALAGEAPT